MSETVPANEPAVDRPPANADVAPPGAAGSAAAAAQRGRFRLPTATLRAYTMLFAMIVISLFLQWATVSEQYPNGAFLDPVNFSKLLKQMAVTGILAVGMLTVIV